MSINNTIIARFAPSPTGHLQLGNLRTLLYNLFAVGKEGKLYIRIEDTDQERSKKEYEDQIWELCEWLSIPISDFKGRKYLRQSERLEVYRKKALDLYRRGHAYYCNCEERPCICCDKDYKEGALRFKVIGGKNLKFVDKVFGCQSIQSENLEDFMLLRRNGCATYHLAVVVDDIFMGINLVIRGNDHLTNSFKQILLYEAFNSLPPSFCHLPMILGKDGKKLSKRHGTGIAMDYKKNGFASEAILNSLMRVGWGHKNDEHFTHDELYKKFSIDRVSKSAGTLNESRLLQQSRYYLRENEEKYLGIFNSQYGYNIDIYTYRILVKHHHTLANVYGCLKEIREYASQPIENKSTSLKLLKHWTWETQTLANHVRGLTREEKQQLRISLTGQERGMLLSDLLYCIGKESVLQRI